MVKHLQNLLNWNQKANDLGLWYEAFGTWVLPNLFKQCSSVDLDLLFGNAH